MSLDNISSPLTVEFSGGEPLVNYVLIRNIVSKYRQMASKKNIELRFAIQTNAVLLTKEIVEFLVRENFSIGISIDGPEEWSRNRLDSKGNSVFNNIMEKIHYLKGVNANISVLGVIYHPNQYDSFIKFALQHEIKNFRLNTLTNIGRSVKTMDATSSVSYIPEDYAKAYIKMAQLLITSDLYSGFKEANLTYFLWSLLAWQPHMCFRTPCGAGKNQLHLSAYGEFYPCQDWRSVNDSKISDVRGELDLSVAILNHDRTQILTKPNSHLYREMCEDCEWECYCGTCAREIFTEYKGDSEKIGMCRFNNQVYEQLCWLFFDYKDEVLGYLGVQQ